VRRRLSKIATLALALALAGCARSGARWGVPGEVRIGFQGDIWTLDPIVAFGQRQIDITQLTTQPLVGISSQNRPIPILCREVPSVANGGISRDGLTITYHLRRHVRFADGVPFTSRDVAFTYRAIIDPRNPVTEASPYFRIASLTTPDAYTVRIRLKHPWSGAVRELFAASDYIYGILPAHAFNDNPDVMQAAWNQRPFGTGPFRVLSWQRGNEIVYVPNPYAWQKPKLHRLIVEIIPDQNAEMVALRAHAIDFADISYPQVAPARADAGLKVVAIPRNNADDIEFQTQGAAMHDLRIRRAVTYAIDRDAIARDVYLGYSPLATTEIPPLFPEHDGAIRAWPYDPAKARALLREVGGARPTVRITFNAADDIYRAVATMLQAQLRAVGFRAMLFGAAPSVLYAPPAAGGIYYDGRFDLAVGGWYGGLDPEASEPWTCANRAPNGPNVARWCDRAYDRAFANQERSLDPAQRDRDFDVMQERVHDDVVAVFTVYRTEFEAMNPSLHGFAPNMLYNFGQTQDWSMR
jgi:peptide/nickel transport system substrate-binding protein